MKQNVSEAESNWHFRKNVKTGLQIKKLYLMSSSRHGHFHPIFACKDGQVTAATCKYYCPLVLNPTITNCCKEFHLKCGKVPKSVFENLAMHKN